MMTAKEKELILLRFKKWFKESLIVSHKRNTQKLTDIKKFQINPFLLYYLANYLEGNSNSESLAKVLVYPRVLQTSITTSFGQGMQKFVTQIFGAYGSVTSGIDIEFIDTFDKRKKYCQLKSGPNSINKDDVETINGHFKSIKNLARTNNLNLQYGDLIFALTYGERSEINSFITALDARGITVLVGKEFWHHFTGDENFYKNLIYSAGEVARDVNMKETVEEVIVALSKSVEQHFKDLYE